MPLTYVSHQVPALAAKLARPAWFDGTALALGSMSPDWPFAFAGTRLETNAHNTRGVLMLCVPASVLAAVAARRLAFAASYLPEFRGLPLRRLALVGERRPPLAVTVASALAGAWSHVAWDSFTHDGRWGARRVRWLAAPHQVGGRAVTGAFVAQHTSTVVGGVVGLVLLSRVLRSGAEGSAAGVAPGAVTPRRAGEVARPDAGSDRALAGPVGVLARPERPLARPGGVLAEAGGGLRPGAGSFWGAVAVGTAAGVGWGCRGGWDGRLDIAVLVIRTSCGTAAGAVVGALRTRRKLRAPASA